MGLPLNLLVFFVNLFFSHLCKNSGPLKHFCAKSIKMSKFKKIYKNFQEMCELKDCFAIFDNNIFLYHLCQNLIQFEAFLREIKVNVNNFKFIKISFLKIQAKIGRPQIYFSEFLKIMQYSGKTQAMGNQSCRQLVKRLPFRSNVEEQADTTCS